MNAKKFLVTLLVLVVLASGATACTSAPKEDVSAAATMAAARATEAAAEATKAAAAQAIAQATSVVQAPPTATPTAVTAQVPIRTATAAPTQAPTPVTEKVEPQGQRFYLHADGILAVTPPPSNSRSDTKCLSECTQTWAITLTHPLQGNAYGYDLVGIGGSYNVRLLHARGDQQTVLAEWLNRKGWQGGPQVDALPGDVLTLEITLALGKSWQPLLVPAGSILTFDYGSYSYVTVATTQQPLPTYPPPPTPTPVVLDTSAAMEIRYGDVITEEIKPSGDVDIYTFDGKAGDVAHIAAAGTKDAPWLSLKIQVFDSQGRPVGAESSGDGEYNLVADGQYTFTVRESGTRTGPYNVVLKNVALGAGTRIGYGDVVEGEISLAGEKDVYTFEGKAGDVARIAMSERKALHARTANLVVKLLDPQGESLGSNDIWVGNTALIERTLTTDGRYTIEIWITGQLDSPETGGYTLLLKNTATSVAARLAYGDFVEGEIRPLGDKDVYTFEWKAGEKLVIEATEEAVDDYSFELYVEVFDPQGNSLAVGSAGQIKPTLSGDGTYTIVVRDKGWHSRFSTGSYTLSLKNLAAP
ncbi:MAG: PPC domain-containing protein [Anaerolineae bacterium]|nr:PPC domain-containing protein [Anaerolineae bacterium]